jgi:outer membrane protein TolC
MKTIQFKHAHGRLTGIFLCLVFLSGGRVLAQEAGTYRLSLQDAISIAKRQNSLVKAAQSEEDASLADYKDAKNAALPSILASSSYQRFTKLTLFDDGLSKSHSVPKYPSANGADANLSASFNLYSGGRQRALESEQSFKKDLAGVNTKEQSANTGLQVAAQYLGVVRLNDQKRFIEEQVVRAETRVKNITALYNNQKVTRSDFLRADLQLSSVKLNLEQTENDITISNQKLNVLLNLPDSTMITVADSANMPRPVVDTLLSLVTIAPKNAFAVNRLGENINIQNARIKSLNSNYSPVISLYSAYGLSYPNTIFFPPVDQAYSIGFVGLKIQYNISSRYQNKNKVSAGKIRLEELHYVQKNINDNVRQEAGSLLIKYREALNRISVNEKSIEQAQVNYKIVSAKYYNQLALLTDLLDADNLYQESKFNLVQSQTSARFIYYQLLYTSGKL